MELKTYYWNIPRNAQNQEKGKILLLHGLGGTGQLWRPLAAKLETDYSILAPDQRGHGLSQDPSITDYSPQAFGSDVVETLQAKNFFPCWIIGHSMGVRTSLSTALIRPDWVQGLVLVDLGLQSPFHSEHGWGSRLVQFLKKLPLRFDSREAGKNFLTENAPDLSIAQYLTAVLKKEENGSWSFPFDPKALIQTTQSTHLLSPLEALESIHKNQIPTLILRGEKSQAWLKNDYERDRQQCKHLSSIVFEEFPGAGHGIPFEKRAEFIERILKFMDSSKNL